LVQTGAVKPHKTQGQGRTLHVLLQDFDEDNRSWLHIPK